MVLILTANSGGIPDPDGANLAELIPQTSVRASRGP